MFNEYCSNRKEELQMNFNIRGENIEVTSALKDYAEKKISKLDRYFDSPPVSEVRVNMRVHNNDQVIEVTIPMQGLLLRAEESNPDMYAAIDSVVSKLERQTKKYKTKVNRKSRQTSKEAQINAFNSMAATSVAVKEEEKDSAFEVVRNKRFNLKPMDAEEAILQMNMLGHNFFVFTNAETNETSVVYKRKDGKYGLIDTE